MEPASKSHMFFLLGEGVVLVFSFFIFLLGKGWDLFALALVMSWLILCFFFWLGWGLLLFHMLYQKVSSFDLYRWVEASQIYNIMKF